MRGNISKSRGKVAFPIKFRVRIHVEPDGGHFYAYCPDLKGLHTCGETEAEAVENAINAVQAYLGSLLKHNDPLPLGVLAISDPLRPWELISDTVGELVKGLMPTRARTHSVIADVTLNAA